MSHQHDDATVPHAEHAPSQAEPDVATADADVDWLRERSMLAAATDLARRYSGSGRMWQHAYAAAQPRAASDMASVWFTAYPPSIITAADDSVLATLGDPALWAAFAELGIEAVHTGPMKRAGGLTGRTFTPTIDGNFDRIGLDMDAALGTTDEFVAMTRTAGEHGAVVIDDIVPGHTGKGPDFRLAERGYADYPGIYHMVEIAPADWSLLPPVPPGKDSANLSPDAVEQLHAKGYIVGRLTRVIFYEPGVKETNWSATAVVRGVDGVERRWVYLHYFKEGQPTLNWLDPSFAGPRLVIGDALHSLDVLGARMLRLDANGFLGVEARPDGPAWSEGHPLSITANQLIAGTVRKAGGFSFQELNLTVDDIAAMSNGGADLAYDFVTRPAYHHALVTGDTGFLRLMQHVMDDHDVDPAGLVHALQNHDELTLELVHFWTLHKDDEFTLGGRTLTGAALRDAIRADMYARLTGDVAPYNLRFVTNGVASTTLTVVAAALGIRDVHALTAADKARMQQAHLLLAMYNALQPGVFALSGWDLVGALTLPQNAVAARLADGDTRWINRGAYDIMDVNPAADASAGGLPRADALYGALPAQLADPNSFASQLKHILAVRKAARLYAARRLAVPDVQHPGLLVLVHALPDGLGIQVTALNFGQEALAEDVVIADAAPGPVEEMLSEAHAGDLGLDRVLRVELAALTGKSYRLRAADASN